MNRAPGVNALLNAARTARQLVARRNAFEDVAAWDAREGGHGSLGSAASAAPAALAGQPAPGAAALQLRDLSSNVLWLLACKRAHGGLSAALEREDARAVEAGLARLDSLLRLSSMLSGLGILRPARTHSVCQRYVERLFHDSVRQGLGAGAVVPGSTKGLHASHMLRIKVEPSVGQLMEQETTHRDKLHMAVQKGFAGTRKLQVHDEDLVGLPENLRKQWVSRFGSWAVWRKAKYSLPVGRSTMVKVMPFCQSASTRERVFEAYYSQFAETGVHKAALDLLRTRQELARRLGFQSWADYELRPLAVTDAAAAQRLLDNCWKDVQKGLAPLHRRMDELASSAAGGGQASSPPAGGQATLANVSQVDEAFFRAVVTREMDAIKLAEFLPAPSALRGLLDVVGHVYNVSFEQVPVDHLQSGWRSSTRVFEVSDTSPHAASLSGRRLGFVYLELEQPRGSWFNPPLALPPGATLLCRGHAYLNMNFSAASRGHTKLLNLDEATMVAHELGHAVHMLCHGGTPQAFDDLPLDLLELPSTLAETVCAHPAVVAQYARHHASGGPPPEGLTRSTLHLAAQNRVRYLQSTAVALGLHSQAFDAAAATADELREEARRLWQRHSAVAAHGMYTPLGEDAGIYLALGASHVAYLLCHLRVDAILHGGARRGGSEARSQDVAKRWLSTDFAGRIRSQLLDKAFPGQRLATLLPPIGAPGAAAVGSDGGGRSEQRSAVASPAASVLAPMAHPLPPPSLDATGMFARRFGAAH